MNKAVLFIHGKGGNAGEAGHYAGILKDCDVIGLDYKSCTPWEAKEEFPGLLRPYAEKYGSVTVIANSIGAYFAMCALNDEQIDRALFISPVVNMERLICDMMTWAGVTEEELRRRKEIETDFGETLSYDYLTYVRDNPTRWNIPTDILYGAGDNLTSYETVSEFASGINAGLTVMENGEHWFHTDEQMEFLDCWLGKTLKIQAEPKTAG